MNIAIVGGGLSGLALGFRLRQRGVEATVFEAATQPGGVAQTVERDGFTCELGPNGFLDNRESILRLCTDLGLADELVRANPQSADRFLFLGERLQRLPATPGEFLRSDVLSVRGRLRFVLERLLGRCGPEDESIRAFGVRHFGAEAADKLLDAVVTGIYAGDFEQLSFPACFPKLAALEREHGSLLKAQMLLARERRKATSLSPVAVSAAGGVLTAPRAGMGRIPQRLAEVLGLPLRLSHRLVELRPDAAGWRLRFDNGHELAAERVVLCQQGPTQAALLEAFDAELAKEVAAIPYAAAAVAVLGFRSGPGAPPPQGFGYLAPERLGRPVLGTIFSSSIYPHQAPAGHFQTRSILGGWRRPDVSGMADADLVELVRADLKTACGIAAEPTFAVVQRWPVGIPQYHVGHLERVRRIDERVRRWPGLAVAGTAYRGVAVEDCAREAERLAAALAESSGDAALQ